MAESLTTAWLTNVLGKQTGKLVDAKYDSNSIGEFDRRELTN